MYEKQVTPGQLKPGMYVSRLDRPWIETPFLLEGFHIKEDADVEEVKKHCDYVYIDVERGDDIGQFSTVRPQFGRLLESANQTQTTEELPQARKCFSKFSNELGSIFDAAKVGGAIEVEPLKKRVVGLVDSAIRNSDASMLLARLRVKDNYTYNHALSVSVLAVALGKRLGFDRNELQTLALSASLFDIGKMQIPDSLLKKSGPLTSDERYLIQKHVELGVNILRDSKVNPDALDVAFNHHERFDGSGYPEKKAGAEIPIFAQIVGLVDSYDAMVSHRHYREAMSHEAVVHELYESRDQLFQADLLEQFIQCLGTYPVGTLVELTSGQVGVVVEQNGVRRLRPQVMLVLDENKQELDCFPIINLLDEVDGSLAIARTLRSSEFGIDPAEYFL